jgi:hypothetical protein
MNQPAQQQDLPGTTAAMRPQPDHGGQSYQGSGKLDGKAAIITSGDSGIGRAWPSPTPAEGPTC